MHPKTHQYCQKLAQECDLQQLENDPEWKLVGKRPKDFVRRLLVLHEERRMTAKDAKQHSWFSNDFHRVDFETVYCRATRHWKPRPLKTPVLEVIDADQVKELPTLQKIELAGQGNDRRRSPVPVDPPYRPYPRKMSSFLLPKRRPGASFIMSDEVRTAIQEKWSLEKMKRQISEVAIDEVPALIPDTESDDQDEPHTKRRFQEQRTADATSGRKAAFTSPFRPLVQRPSSLNGKKVSNHDTTFGKSVVQDQPSHVNACHSGSQHGSADQTSRTNLDSPNQAKASQISTDSATSYDHSLVSKVPVVSTQDRSNHGASDLPTSNQTELSHSAKEGGIAPKVLQMVNHSPKSKIDEVAGGQDTKMKGGPNFASRGPDVNTTIDPTKSAQTSPQRVEKKAVALKLRSPLLARLNPVLRQQAKSKKRCGSIFDLDEDEDTEQRQHELSKLTLEADRAPKSGYFRKRPRIDQSVEVQTGSDEDSRFSIWSGGETLGIPGAFKNLSFSQ